MLKRLQSSAILQLILHQCLKRKSLIEPDELDAVATYVGMPTRVVEIY